LKRVNIRDVVDAARSNWRTTSTLVRIRPVKMDFIASAKVAAIPRANKLKS
jgi:hypothetical protein